MTDSTLPPSHAEWQRRAAALQAAGDCYIDGRFQPAEDGRTFDKTNPATGQSIASVARGSAADIDRAVRSARSAFRAGVWSRIAPRERMSVLYRLAELINQHVDELALLDCLDMGKPITAARDGDVPFAALTFQYFAEAIDKMEGAVTNTDPAAL